MNLHQNLTTGKFIGSKKIISTILASALLLSSTTPAFSATNSPTPENNTTLTATEQANLEELLNFIEQIPDEAFENNEKYYQYINNNLPPEFKNTTANTAFRGIAIEDDVNPLGCLGAAGVAVIGSFPPAKIFKIRSVIKSAGGVKTFVEKIKAHSKDAKDRGVTGRANMEYSLKNAAGDAWPDVQDALLDFLGITGVAAACGITWE